MAGPDTLRDGVRSAVEVLGTGFLRHPGNDRLRAGLDAGTIRLGDLHSALLRTVFRLLVWFVAEDRDALLDPAADAAARARHAELSGARLRRAACPAGHPDGGPGGEAGGPLWPSVQHVLAALGRDGDPELGLPGLGGLFAVRSGDELLDRLCDPDLLDAVRALPAADLAEVDGERLGSGYEALLELVPRYDPVARTFRLEPAGGHERRTTGSYYTPGELVDAVLDAALDPVLDAAQGARDPETALLALTVCDPACGSGHFLVAAARRIADRVAAVRHGPAARTDDRRRAVHDVVDRCLYGVDLNPMAVDLAAVSLWLEAPEPGRPLSFLDHRLRVGDALVGATPAVLPDGAHGAHGADGAERADADAWCAGILAGPAGSTPDGFRPFHWHLEFPEVLRAPAAGSGPDSPAGWAGGFDVVVGNPPWEQVKLKEREFFSSRAPQIARARTAAARKAAIAGLAERDALLWNEFRDAKERSEAEARFLLTSGRFPLTGKGDVNRYAVFAELMRQLVAARGRVGVVTPTGLATDQGTSAFFRDTLAAGRLVAFTDYENSADLFAAVSPGFRLAVTVMSGTASPAATVPLAFRLRPGDRFEQRSISLSPKEILLLNPTTGTLPLFASREDAEVTLAVYRANPVLATQDGTSPWGVLPRPGLFHMTSDSPLFVESSAREGADGDGADDVDEADGGDLAPLYEGRLVAVYDHRFATYPPGSDTTRTTTAAEHDDVRREVRTRFGVPRAALARRQELRLSRQGWDRDWALCWRNITSPAARRVLVAAVVPTVCVGNSLQMMLTREPGVVPVLQAILSSLVVDYLARQKVSGNNLTLGLVRQLPAPGPDLLSDRLSALSDDPARWVRERVLELTYTSASMARHVADCRPGEPGAPYRWDPDRRALLRAELDAAMLHAFGLGRGHASHVVSSFGLLAAAESREHGEFRTGRLVLERYDAMAEAAGGGRGYASPLDPPAGAGLRHELATESR